MVMSLQILLIPTLFMEGKPHDLTQQRVKFKTWRLKFCVVENIGFCEQRQSCSRQLILTCFISPEMSYSKPAMAVTTGKLLVLTCHARSQKFRTQSACIVDRRWPPSLDAA